MALTLLEAAKANPGEVFRNAIIEEYAKQSDILRVLPFIDLEGNSYKYNREDTLPGVGFRGVNEAFSESTGILNPQVESLVIAGGDLDVDNFILSTNGPGTRSQQEMMKVKALSLRFTKEFIKGDSALNARVFDGLQKRVTGTQLIDAGSTSGGNALTLNKLDELIDAVDNPTHLLMNKAMRRRLSAASRNQSVGGYITYEIDQFGRRVGRYQDLEILIVDYDESGAQIMPFTEAAPAGGTAQCTSIYCLSIGDGMLQGIQGKTKSGKYGVDARDLGELPDKPVHRTRVEWYCGFGIWHGRAAARLQGITDAAITA